MDRQAHGPAPFLGNDPEIALITEDDFPIGNVRVSASIGGVHSEPHTKNRKPE